MNWDNFTKEGLLSRFLQLEQRLEELEQENDRKDEKIEQLEEQWQEKNERIEKLKARLRQYENPHTPPSKRRSATDESPTSQDDEDDDNIRTDGEMPGRKQGHDPAWRAVPEPDEEIEVTRECCPACGDSPEGSVGVTPRLVEGIPDPQPPQTTQYNRHRYECHF